MTQKQKEHFGHVESKTSSQLFPPIGSISGFHRRSRSTLNELSMLRKLKNSQMNSQNLDDSLGEMSESTRIYIQQQSPQR